MDVMACSVSRSGNYQPQLDYVQAIFPDRECLVWLGQDSVFCFPIGKQKTDLNSKLTPIYTQCGAVFRTAPRPLLCGEWISAKYRLAHARNSAFMDFCQLIRKETKMEVVHLNQKQLAARRHLSEARLERWRSEGIGPKFMKLKGVRAVQAGRHRSLRGVVPCDVDQDLNGSSQCWLMCSVLSAIIDKCRRFAT